MDAADAPMLYIFALRGCKYPCIKQDYHYCIVNKHTVLTIVKVFNAQKEALEIWTVYYQEWPFMVDTHY